jgi:thiosulfate/3-mercaptopyruvate sulfurtransferase
VSPIITAAELAAELEQESCIVVDCRFRLLAPNAGYEAYCAGHLPTARYAHLDRDLARKPRAHEGRHPLPDPAAFARVLERWGVAADSRVVAYDDQSGAIASRLWWMLRWIGHENAAVLDGGLQSWTDLEMPLAVEKPEDRPSQYLIGRIHEDWVVSSDDLAKLDLTDIALLDARSPARFNGEKEPIDAIAGHIPGARNWPFETNVDDRGRLVGANRIREAFDEHLGDSSHANFIAMCGSGVTACHLLWALECAGITGGKLYAGSWSEWIRDPARPIAN